MMEHQAGEGHKTQPRYRFRQAFVILGEPAEARRLGEGALHHPPPRQQHEAVLSDHLRSNAVFGGVGGDLLPGVA